MIYPQLYLVFETSDEAKKAVKQHICLSRNEDLLLPDPTIIEMTKEEFDQLDGFELIFEKNDQSFLVGYNRFNNNQPMYGWLNISGNPIQKPKYE
jgi:hypothetical protein